MNKYDNLNKISQMHVLSNNTLSYLQYDPCHPTSTCSRRWPYKIPVHTSYSTVHCVSYLTGINSYDEPSQGISK